MRNQRLNAPQETATSLNLADQGWVAARTRMLGRGTLGLGDVAGPEATVNACGVAVGEAAGVELGADPVDRYMVNVGTVPGLPHPASSQLVDGQVHRRLMTPGRGGGSVVVRASESGAHGEGTQRVRSTVAGMPGGRR